MKYLSSQPSALFPSGETRTNLAALLRYVPFLALLVSAYAVLFGVILRVASVLLTTSDDAMNVYLAVYRATGIGSRTGLSVVAVDERGKMTTQLTGDTVLPAGGTLLMLGSRSQRDRFAEAFERTDA
jgi:hypothetical protein